MNSIRSFCLPFLLLVTPLTLGGCAAAEQDADNVANTAAQGLEGKGRLYTEKVMKDQVGNDFQ